MQILPVRGWFADAVSGRYYLQLRLHQSVCDRVRAAAVISVFVQRRGSEDQDRVVRVRVTNLPSIKMVKKEKYELIVFVYRIMYKV